MSKINVTSPLMPEFDIYVEKLQQIWDSHWLTNNGRMYAELKEKLEKRMNGFVELFVNGHMALDIAIKALNLKGEVITTPFTFASTTHALTMNGCTPVFCDINPDTYTIDADKIESLITEKTCAIVPVHVYGCVCDVEKIEGIAKKYGLKVIYDAAHAFDVRIGGRSIAEYGDVSMFSFHATKVFNTVEGGALVYHDQALTSKLRNLRNFGIESEESVTAIGLNAKMNELCAAMGLCNLEVVDSAIARRKEIVSRYLTILNKISGIKTLNYDAMHDKGIEYNYAYMPIEIDPQLAGYTRDELHDFLLSKDIGTRKYFYPLIVDFECYREKYRDVQLPIAERVAERILTLPLSSAMTNEDVKLVCDALQEMAHKKI